MLTNTKQIESAISEILENENFKKKENSWYMDGVDSICVINLQKSDWGGQYYVNLGVSLKCLESSPFPKEHKCHIRSRLSRLVEDSDLLNQSLNLENHAFDSEKRILALEGAIKGNALPLFKKMESLQGIKDLVGGGFLDEFWISPKVKEVLGFVAP